MGMQAQPVGKSVCMGDKIERARKGRVQQALIPQTLTAAVRRQAFAMQQHQG
jgi:hypothetical protein